MNAKRFYAPRKSQNPAVLSSSECEEKSEDITCEDSDSYCPSKLSSSNSLESDFNETTPESSDDDDQSSSSFNSRPLGSWSTDDGSHRKQLVFTDDNGIYVFTEMSATTVKPIDIYSMMITHDVYDLIVEQTNLNAQQSLMTQPVRSSRLKKWKDTDKTEIKKFLAIVLYMGMVKLPTIYSYWSKDLF